MTSRPELSAQDSAARPAPDHSRHIDVARHPAKTLTQELYPMLPHLLPARPAARRPFATALRQGLGRAAAALSLALVLCLPANPALAAAPPAGTNIGNQASATYSDSSNLQRTVTSNLVTTVVQQVASSTLQQALAKTATAGSQASFPITLTNTGNGSDSFNLSFSQSGSFSFGSVQFYADANGDGVPDSTTPITVSDTLAAGAVFRFVAVGTVPAGAATGSANSLVVSATSVFNAGAASSVTESTTVPANAVVNVSKSMSASSGNAGSGPYTVTLTYSNTGNTGATAINIADVLPAGMVYVAASGRWSATGALVLTDASDGTQGTSPTIDYSVTGSTVRGIINSLAAGQAGTVSFQVTLASGLAAGTLNNTASFSYNDGAGSVGPVSTNTFGLSVNQTAGVTLSGATVASALQGSTVSFSNTLVNTGNATDSFDISVAAGSPAFPPGSAFALYKADGVTPMVDTNGNGVVDTGPVAAGASTTVVLKVTLPAGASGGPYNVSKTATSRFNAGLSATTTDSLTSITANSVDLTNNAAGAGAPGLGAGPEGSPVVSNSVNPGATTRFTLYASNGSGAGDSFNLAASTDASFASSSLPAGWTVVFRDAAGTVITNTGVVAGGSAALVYADVTVPANQAAVPAGQSLYFRVLSPSSGASDRLADAVVVNTVRSVTLTPNNSGQLFPGGSVVYSHTLTNAGNVAENGGANTITLALAQTGSGFTSVVYLDANGSNTIDAGDTVVLTASDLGSLAPGQSKQLLVKVTAQAGVAIGAVSTATLTATSAGAVNGSAAPAAVSATDQTSVAAGNMVLQKEHALDAACDGNADTAFTTAAISSGAVPGACIRYRLTATNNGSANVTNLVVSDATPSHTTYSATVAAATSQGTMAAPANGSAGTFTATVGTLPPSASVVVSFGVRINP